MYVGVDVGGTFTDIAVNLDDGSNMLLHKVPSTPDAPERALIAGLSEIFEEHGLSASRTRRLAHGTTVGTNALIQRKCGKVALVTSRGFRDLLEIGRQIRPTVYNMHLDHPSPLVERSQRLEVPQRRLADGTSHVPLDEAAVVKVAGQLAREDIDCVVVCFLHSYAFPADERRAARLLEQHLPDRIRVLTSSAVYPEFREYERFSTAVLNGALLNVVGSYLDRLRSRVNQLGIPGDIKIGQSSGGLMSVRMAREFPVRASLSGPAAGVQGALRRAQAAGFQDIITLDVGGTSADVALLLGGRAVELNERDIAGYPVRLPALDVNAVGAGGGSIAWIDRDGFLKVGPRSAGAIPGPACYGQGGTEATLTDANLLLGRLNGTALLNGRMPVDLELAKSAVGELAKSLGTSVDETALGIVQVACATMVKAIRSVSIERGHDPRDFVLFVYGGAGALHATEVARELRIGTVIVPSTPGILCAEGALNSYLTTEFVVSPLLALEVENMPVFRDCISKLKDDAENWFRQESASMDARKTRWSIGARYFGQNFELALPVETDRTDEALFGEITDAFHSAHELSYGFASKSERIQIVSVMVKAVIELERPALPEISSGIASRPVSFRSTMFDRNGRVNTPVYSRQGLAAGQQLVGPAIVEQMDSTTLVFPGSNCAVDVYGNLVMKFAE